jgi:N-acetylneuraminate synthase
VKKEVDFLVDKLNTPFIKVASMDLNNYPFLEYIAKKRKPIVLSTGLSELHEIDKAIKTIENAGNNKIVILHCVATYPTPDKEVNLNNMKTLMSLYPNYPVGFSDHTMGSCIPLAAVGLGACLLEKHFTLDQNMEGWDHKISATKDQMKDIVINSKRIYNALGSKRITVTESKEKITEFRRSIVLANNLKVGDIIQQENLTFKRPGTGITPGDLKYVIGRKLNQDLQADTLLKWEYLK